MDYDRVLIEQSIAKQYGVLPSAQEDLHYVDWAKLVGGLMNDTPLGQIVGIRCEKDRDIVKNMSQEQKRLRTEWAAFRASGLSQQDTKIQMKQLEQLIAGLFGGR